MSLRNRLRGWLGTRPDATGFDESDAIWDAVRNRQTGVLVDVGAHHGTFLNRYLNAGWRVFAFEPDPDNRARLSRSPKLTISEDALGAVDGQTATLYANTESTGISSLSAFTAGHTPKCTVNVRTLEAVAQPLGIGGCDVLKVDAEGHDLFVLHGVPWTQWQPDVVMCEFEDRKTLPIGYSYRTLGDFLVEKGYAVFLSEWAPIIRYGTQHTWRRVVPYPATTLEANAWGNFLAFKPSVAVPKAISSKVTLA